MIIRHQQLVRAYGYAVPRLWVSVALVCLVALPATALAQDSVSPVDEPTVITITDEPPPGFESLMEPQSLYVDVYFNERKAGTFQATTDGETLRFEDPSTVVEALGAVKDPEAVSALLEQALPAHPELVCFRPNEPLGCGHLEPTPIGLIYDESRLRVDLFLDSALQVVQSFDALRHLPQPQKRSATLLALNAVATDIERGDSRLDLGARFLAGRGATHFRAEMDYTTRDSRYRLEELALTHHFADYELLVGNYRADLGGGLTGVDVLGTSFGHSMKTRVDLGNALSAELVVYLPRRSVVQLVLNDRIYSGRRYDAGNQSIDTSGLPNGTYDLEIRINDPITGPRSEFQLYTKSTKIPPRGESLAQLQFGVPLEHVDGNVLPETSRSLLAALTFSSRLTDHSALTLGLLQIGGEQLLQSELTWLGRHLSLQASGSVGTADTVAFNSRATYRRKRFTASIDARWFTSAIDATDNRFLSGVFTPDTRQLSLTLNQSFGRSSISFRNTIRQRDVEDGSQTNRRHSLTLRRRLFQRRSLQGTVDATYQRSTDSESVSLSIRVQARPSSSHSISANSRFQESNGESSNYNAGLSARHRTGDRGAGEYTSEARLDTTRDRDTAGLAFDYISAQLDAGVSTEWERTGSDNGDLNSVGSIRALLGADQHGLAVTGGNVRDSGVILDVRGKRGAGLVDVFVNDTKLTTARIGSSTLLGLSPYREYRISLIPHSLLALEGKQLNNTFTLHPGNVQRLVVNARREVLLIGVLIDESGALLSNANIGGGELVNRSDEQGVFQIAGQPGQLFSVGTTAGKYCLIKIPAPTTDDYVQAPGTSVVCKPDPRSPS